MVDGLPAHEEYFDKPRRTIERVADTPEELINWVNRVARPSGHGECVLNQATPTVGSRMPDGSRVTASLGSMSRRGRCRRRATLTKPRSVCDGGRMQTGAAAPVGGRSATATDGETCSRPRPGRVWSAGRGLAGRFAGRVSLRMPELVRPGTARRELLDLLRLARDGPVTDAADSDATQRRHGCCSSCGQHGPAYTSMSRIWEPIWPRALPTLRAPVVRCLSHQTQARPAYCSQLRSPAAGRARAAATGAVIGRPCNGGSGTEIGRENPEAARGRPWGR